MADGAFYAGVEAPGGYGSTGYIVHADGSIFPASSGGAKYLDTPPGTWAVGRKLDDKWAPGDGGPEYKKYQYQLHPIGTSDDTPIPDPRYKKSDHPGERTEIMGHVQHFSLDHGSLGCIAVQDRTGVNQFASDGTITVDHSSQSLEEVQAKIEQRLGHKVDWTKIKKPVPPKGMKLGGDRSKTKKGNQIKAKDHGVLIGPQGRKVSYLTAPLSSGGQVTKGTSTITVGMEQYLVAAVTHDTTDGSPIANGEDSVTMIT